MKINTTYFKLKERYIYGSSRVGVRNSDLDLLPLSTQNYSMKSVHYSIGSRTYELSNHLGNVLSVISDKVIPVFPYSNVISEMRADIRVAQDYSPFGVTLDGRDFVVSEGYRYGFGSHEKDDEVSGNGNHYSFGDYGYDPRGARRWNIDPVINPSVSPYAVFNNNPIYFIDMDGRRPLPVNATYNGMGWRIDSGFGTRDPKDKKASRFHKGVDLNTTGGGATDYGAPVLATHTGIVKIVHDSNKKKGGRYIQIVSPDGSFFTQYLHLSLVSVVEGQEVKEGDQIGNVGSSGRGSETGVPSHLHYEIGLLDSKGRILKKIDPLFDNDEDARTNNEIGNLVDPQMWVDGIYEVGTMNPTKVEKLEELIVRPTMGPRTPEESSPSTPIPMLPTRTTSEED